MDIGECSGNRAEDSDIWARLVPSNSGCSSVNIRSAENIIESLVSCSSSEKQRWCKIIRTDGLDFATIKNISSRTIIVNGTPLGKEEDMLISYGCEIIPGPDKNGYLTYEFQVLPTGQNPSNSIKVPLDVNNMKCSICLNIWHDVVTVAPCHHNFCNGCFSIWAKRCQKERRQVFCPQCRSITHSVGKNHILHYLEEVILLSHSSLRRCSEELALLDKNAIATKLDLLLLQGSLASNEDSYMSDEASEMELDCPQCGIEIGGFRCNSSTVHLQCYGCRGMMPSRPDVGVPQNCLGCAKIFCGAYWRAHNFIADGIHFICNPTTLQPLSEHRITSIPGSTHGRNIHEQDITRRCIQQVGKALPDLIQEWIVKLDNREFDRAIIAVNHVDMLTSQTHLCNNCTEKVIDGLLYWFRVSLPRRGGLLVWLYMSHTASQYRTCTQKKPCLPSIKGQSALVSSKQHSNIMIVYKVFITCRFCINVLSHIGQCFVSIISPFLKM
ncbi:E3 ubiquitin-protein ligase CHFR isoform X2 [Amborella trichopoda]|uniref:E3 ubiquitin-protein ligase CHFR isoform X2 n=1 Tax=Amborella trichopoda TaxID=13333 RepID=UPI0009BF5F68|nr:E3 ubiquitin-protein ligase CHFR isoform X2 [Amborella trichopoda]|eukprot:XP_020524566.1 E3 ubiquitin-protein ligase CHFR isoform X2 [Amborella trichopoda]